MAEMIAIIRIRGTDDVDGRIASTMEMLRLNKKHVCSVYPKTDAIMGMALRCKDYVTYGEIDEPTYKLLVEKRGGKKNKTQEQNKTQNKKQVSSNEASGKSLTEIFHLQPPRGGFGRGGIKLPFTMKGALGYRGAKINDLIKKMI